MWLCCRYCKVRIHCVFPVLFNSIPNAINTLVQGLIIFSKHVHTSVLLSPLSHYENQWSGHNSVWSPLARSAASLLRTRPGQRVLGKGSRQSLLAADLLAANKTLYCNGNCSVNVLCWAVFGETHSAERFANSNDGFKMTNLERRC